MCFRADEIFVSENGLAKRNSAVCPEWKEVFERELFSVYAESLQRFFGSGSVLAE